MEGPGSNRKELSLRARPYRGSSMRAGSSTASLHTSPDLLRAGLGEGPKPCGEGQTSEDGDSHLTLRNPPSQWIRLESSYLGELEGGGQEGHQEERHRRPHSTS